MITIQTDWPRPERSLVAELQRAAQDAAGHEFLRFERASWTFDDVWQAVQRAAHVLATNGVRAGDRVVIRLPNDPEWVVAWFAIWRVGGVTVPTNYAYGVADLSYAVADSEAVAIVTDADSRQVVSDGIASADRTPAVISIRDLLTPNSGGECGLMAVGDIRLESLANLQYTSGTMGFPKACMLAHEYWVRLGQMIAHCHQIRGSDVMLTAQPFSYIDPQWNVAVCLLARIPLVIMPRFSASRFWETVRAQRVTVFYVLGTMPTLLHKQPRNADDLNHAVRLVLCSGIPPDLHAQLEQRWGVPWREGFGMTETGVDTFVPQAAVDCVGSGTIGWPVGTKQARVVDVRGNDVAAGTPGELVLRGQPMMQGYWNKPQATARAFAGGWFHSGDLARQNRDGSFAIVGRIKDMVRRSGENIAAAEVENVANNHIDVIASAVIGVPDELWGEEVKLFIQPRQGVAPSRALADSIGHYIRQRLAPFKSPRYVTFVEAFPMTPSQRIAKPNIPDRFAIDNSSVFEVDYGASRRSTNRV